LRMRNAVEADMERAIADRRIIGAWPMRGVTKPWTAVGRSSAQCRSFAEHLCTV
jgi:hypothetical protein